MVFPLRVRQLAALLRFPCWLTPVGCSTPAVMVSHGVGGCLVTVVLFPPLFFFFVPTPLPLPLLPLRGSAPLPSGLACLSPACWSTPRVGLEGSGCVLFLRACSIRCFPWAWFAGLILLRLLAGLCGLCNLCQGAPVAGCLLGLQVGFPCCFFFPLEWVCFWLRCPQSLWAAKAVSAALRGSSSSSCVC